ncbi:Follistatin-related protein 5, partial [Trichinella spiralis]
LNARPPLNKAFEKLDQDRGSSSWPAAPYVDCYNVSLHYSSNWHFRSRIQHMFVVLAKQMQLIISNWWMLLWTFYPEHQLCQCLCPSIDQLTRSVPFECNNIIGPSRSKCERHPMINNGKKNSLFLQLQHLLNPTTGFLLESSEIFVEGKIFIAEKYFLIYTANLCRTVFCNRGEECILENDAAKCKCITSCYHNDRPVCGSNGVTYPSRCHLHREACLEEIRIKILHKGECKQFNASKWKTMKTSSPLPISNSTTLIKNGQVEKKKNSISTEVPFTEKTKIQANSCDHSDFQILINNLMLYFHAKFAENYVGTVEHGKAFLVRLMFQTFNKNDDQIIDNEDLKQTGEDERYHKLLPTGCDFTLLLRHGDVDSDGQLSLTEFMQIFGNSYKITEITTLIITTCATCLVEFQGLDSKSGKRRYQLIKKHIIETGTHYQLFCDVDHSLNPSLQVRWYRYDVPLISVAPNHFQISMDGSLYLTPAESVHHGNFTCKLGFHDEQVQIHIVNIVGK